MSAPLDLPTASPTEPPVEPPVEPRRVQRVPERWPVVHLEAEVPQWSGLVVDGMVAHARRFDLAALRALGAEERTIDFHCVWGWSRPQERWTGVGLDRVLALAGPAGPGASHVCVTAASDDSSACIPVEVAARGFLAWARDDRPLPPLEGDPAGVIPHAVVLP